MASTALVDQTYLWEQGFLVRSGRSALASSSVFDRSYSLPSCQIREEHVTALLPLICEINTVKFFL